MYTLDELGLVYCNKLSTIKFFKIHFYFIDF